jgi:hypothetical protein
LVLKGYFVQYKFYLPARIKHSSYSYQKLFRAIYGYTQSVNKASGKTYKYHRPGILSFSPYINTGKNSVIIPEEDLPKLLDFFKTGANPTHRWQTKGEWKVTYFINETNVKPNAAVSSLEELIDRAYIKQNKTKVNIFDAMKYAVNSIDKIEANQLQNILSEAKKIVSRPWFNECLTLSNKLQEFKDLYLNLFKSKK